MNEIYWITRLDAIRNFFTTVSILCFFSFGILCIAAIFIRYDAEDFEENGENIETSKMCLYFAKRCAIAFFVSVSINAFTPTTNDALLIYGLGGTIDYIKSNDTAKQLPDKCVKALDKYLENLTKEENQKENG